MTLLGKNLDELRRLAPDRRLSHSTVLRIGIQAIQALHDLHTAGFVHRNV